MHLGMSAGVGCPSHKYAACYVTASSNLVPDNAEEDGTDSGRTDKVLKLEFKDAGSEMVALQSRANVGASSASEHALSSGGCNIREAFFSRPRPHLIKGRTRPYTTTHAASALR